MNKQNDLNPEQKRAIETTEGPVLIVAGAGSGKTKTLTHRIAHLLHEKKVQAKNILAVTFTNKAAEEMRNRIQILLNQTAINTSDQEINKQKLITALPHIGTFHSICSRILRKEISTLGYKPTFTILDSDDQLALMRRVMKSLDINPKNIHPRSLLETISRAKNTLIDTVTFEAQAGSYFEELIAKSYQKYQEELQGNHSLDFDDLLILTIRIFQKFPEILASYQKLFQYILVDEYQDTNHAQYTLIHLLAEKHRNLFVIGDDYQSIYGWRQADIRNILNFEKDYPEAAIITLDQNYRSSQIILDAAGSIIIKNTNQRHKNLWTEKKAGDLITVFEAEDENDEAKYTTKEIQTILKKNNRPFSDFAILYRTNAQSRALEEACLHTSLPYEIIGGLKFYQRKEIKDAIAYLRIIANHSDTISLARVINEPPRGIGTKTLEKWLTASKNSNSDPFTFIREAKENILGIAQSKWKSLEIFSTIIQENTKKLEEHGTFSSFLSRVLETTGYQSSINDGTEEGTTRAENVQELFSVSTKYDKIPLKEALIIFLEEVSLVSDIDFSDGKSNTIRLMTIHSAKGLEFPFVFIVGLEEGIFPHSRSALSPSELEEERRLMYVGLTRAKEKVWLISAKTRMIFGSTHMNAPSRFISEIPSKLTLFENQNKKAKKYTDTKKQMGKRISSLEKKPLNTFRPGDSVTHPTFGNGVVLKIESTLATVAFRKFGVKKLALGIAPLEKI